MTEKRFKLNINQNNQWDIVDLVESKEKNAICIYNDLGHYHFSSAKALCELLNELHEENIRLKRDFDSCYHKWVLMYDEAKEKVEALTKENRELKQRVQQLENNIEKYIGAKYKKFVDGEVGGWSIGTVNELLNELSDENE